MGGMGFFQGGPEDLMRLLSRLSGESGGDRCQIVGCPCGGAHKVKRSIKMDGADIANHQSLIARNDALKKDYDRARSKLIHDAERNWADIKDKHNLHGEETIHINAEKGEIEVLE